jgi:hypothetical protein
MIDPVRRVRFALVLVPLLIIIESASGAAARDPAPFIYKFQVTKFTSSSIFKLGDAVATEELHLATLPKAKGMPWWGRKGLLGRGGQASMLIRVAGTATYSGLDPACNGTFELDPSRWKPITATLSLSFSNPMKVVVSATRYPLPTAYPGSCQKGRGLSWWEGALASAPLSVLQKKSFTATQTFHKQAELGETIDWTVSFTVKRLSYRKIDCSRTQLC